MKFNIPNCTLLSFSTTSSLPTANIYVILVKRGREYVVSQYIDGRDEWVQGHYFDDPEEARAYFAIETLSWVRVSKTHVHSQSASLLSAWALASREKENA